MKETRNIAAHGKPYQDSDGDWQRKYIRTQDLKDHMTVLTELQRLLNESQLAQNGEAAQPTEEQIAVDNEILNFQDIYMPEFNRQQRNQKVIWARFREEGCAKLGMTHEEFDEKFGSQLKQP